MSAKASLFSPAELDLLRKVADRLLGYRFSFWHYGDSIGFEGLLAASDLLGDTRYESWAHGAIRASGGDASMTVKFWPASPLGRGRGGGRGSA